MIDENGLVKILDFGLAKLKGVIKLTAEISTLGTLNYMSPEQIQGGEVNQQSDIWSLGIVFYELVTGLIPFNSEYSQGFQYAILNKKPEPVQNFVYDVPYRLIDLIIIDVAENMGQDQVSIINASLMPFISSMKNVDLVLYGDLIKAGDKLRIDAKLRDTSTGEIIKSEPIEGTEQDDLIKNAKVISNRLKDFFEIKTLEQNVDYELRNVLTSSADAYRNYLFGMDADYKMDWAKAIGWLLKTVNIDTSSYNLLGTTG